MLLHTFPVGPLQCNCTILGDETSGTAVVIDPGDEAGLIVQELDRLGLRVSHLLHTHAHLDHVGATGAVRRARGGRALLHAGDEMLLDFAAQIRDVEQRLGPLGIPVPEPLAMDGRLEEGDRIAAAGSALEVLHTPGHTPGSCSFVLHATGRQIVWSGDTLFAGGIGRTDLWGGDSATIARSLRGKLLALDDEAEVICGHGTSTSIGAERRGNPFLNGSWRW